VPCAPIARVLSRSWRVAGIVCRWVATECVDQIAAVLAEVVAAVAGRVNPRRRRNCFELMGADFMFTHDFRPMLIEVNANPCLEFSTPYLEVLLPRVVGEAFRIAVDPHFPPPKARTKAADAAVASLEAASAQNRFRLIYEQPKQASKAGDKASVQASVRTEPPPPPPPADSHLPCNSTENRAVGEVPPRPTAPAPEQAKATKSKGKRKAGETSGGWRSVLPGIRANVHAGVCAGVHAGVHARVEASEAGARAEYSDVHTWDIDPNDI